MDLYCHLRAALVGLVQSSPIYDAARIPETVQDLMSAGMKDVCTVIVSIPSVGLRVVASTGCTSRMCWT